MRTSNIPPLEELKGFCNNRKIAAKHFGVTEKTIVRWMAQYNLYQPKHNYGCNKLDMDKAREIRASHKAGASIKDIAAERGVTMSTVSRIIHNISYRDYKEVADVTVIYNPTSVPVLFGDGQSELSDDIS
jgi:lambda repressor-like predicted transcriptional regulator